jgi:hypothetical protein
MMKEEWTMSEPLQKTGMYVSNLDKAKNDAYFILSDAGQIGKRTVNLKRLIKSHHAEIETINFTEKDHVGAVSHDSKGNMILKVSNKIAGKDSHFELATLLAMMITCEAKTRLGNNRMYPHSKDSALASWKHAEDVAMFILMYHVSPREVAMLTHKNSDKMLARLAEKKGIPTKHLLRRLSLEIGI